MNESVTPKKSVAGDITRLLAGFKKGNALAEEKLASLVYAYLRRIASTVLRGERSTHSLQPTALVHEAFLHMMAGKRPSIKNRAHFFAIAAHAMRQILVDHARKKKAVKRGAGETAVELDDELNYSDEKSGQLIALDDALNELAAMNPRQASVVELRFFGGMTTQETAAALQIGVTTVNDDWQLAKAWLRRELES